jgi:hypothetical protein
MEEPNSSKETSICLRTENKTNLSHNTYVMIEDDQKSVENELF